MMERSAVNHERTKTLCTWGARDTDLLREREISKHHNFKIKFLLIWLKRGKENLKMSVKNALLIWCWIICLTICPSALAVSVQQQRMKQTRETLEHSNTEKNSFSPYVVWLKSWGNIIGSANEDLWEDNAFNTWHEEKCECVCVCVCVCRDLDERLKLTALQTVSVCEEQNTTGDMLQRISSASVLPNNSTTHTHTHTLLPDNSPAFFHSNYLLVHLSCHKSVYTECVHSGGARGVSRVALDIWLATPGATPIINMLFNFLCLIILKEAFILAVNSRMRCVWCPALRIV